MKKRKAMHRNKSYAYILDPYKALKFTVEFILMMLFFSAGKVGYALALGRFSGLVYARQNLLIISPLYIIAGGVFLNDWLGLIFLVAPPLVFAVLYFAYTMIGKIVNEKFVLRKRIGKKPSEEEAAAIAMALDQELNGEVYAAIGMALHQYMNDTVHDTESYIITIKRKHR